MNGWADAFAPLRDLNERIRLLGTSGADPRRRAVWTATFLLGSVAIGVALGAGDVAAVLWGLSLAAIVILLARVAARPGDRRALLGIAALAIAIHMAGAACVYAFAPRYGGGFVTADDFGYFRLSAAAARLVRGLPLDPTFAPP